MDDAGKELPVRQEVQCKRCGSDMEHMTCDQCGGEGVDGHDCGEDCCPCLNPEDNVQCDRCDGHGGWYVCLSEPEWCEAHPLKGREKVKRSTEEWFDV